MDSQAGQHGETAAGSSTVRDRVVQAALRLVLEPIFERDFAAQSYGFRPNRGCKDALRRVEELLQQGYTWIVDVDLKSYFDTIPHEPLMEQVSEKISDGEVLGLVEAFLNQQVLDGMESWAPEGGTPQGAVLSPLLSNLYLNPLDQQMAEPAIELVRYADDFVLLCRSQTEAERALERVREWTVAARTDAGIRSRRGLWTHEPGELRLSGLPLRTRDEMPTSGESKNCATRSGPRPVAPAARA